MVVRRSPTARGAEERNGRRKGGRDSPAAWSMRVRGIDGGGALCSLPYERGSTAAGRRGPRRPAARTTAAPHLKTCGGVHAVLLPAFIAENGARLYRLFVPTQPAEAYYACVGARYRICGGRGGVPALRQLRLGELPGGAAVLCRRRLRAHQVGLLPSYRPCSARGRDGWSSISSSPIRLLINGAAGAEPLSPRCAGWWSSPAPHGGERGFKAGGGRVRRRGALRGGYRVSGWWRRGCCCGCGWPEGCRGQRRTRCDVVQRDG